MSEKITEKQVKFLYEALSNALSNLHESEGRPFLTKPDGSDFGAPIVLDHYRGYHRLTLAWRDAVDGGRSSISVRDESYDIRAQDFLDGQTYTVSAGDDNLALEDFMSQFTLALRHKIEVSEESFVSQFNRHHDSLVAQERSILLRQPMMGRILSVK